jgi:myo-inositol-1(or 4)-monophosphatase
MNQLRNQKDVDRRFEFVKVLIREAGNLALNFFIKRNQLKVEKKGLQDFVSIADKEVEAFIRKKILDTFPDDGFLGEENAEQDIIEARRNQVNYIWVVDPIDGTTPFLNGIPSWCISIALVEKDQIKLGFIYDPNTNELYSAQEGKGALLNDEPMVVADANQISDGPMGIGYSFRVEPDIIVKFFKSFFENGGMYLRNGSGALSLAYVAAGKLIGYYEPHINSWDSLAAILMIKEAGGWTNDFLANDGLLKGNEIIGCAPKLVDQLKIIIASSSR